MGRVDPEASREGSAGVGKGLRNGLRVAALIPALDEEEALPHVLAALDETSLVHEVVVVDNGSTDATAAVARRGGATVVREEERGYGVACLAGIRHLAASPAPPDLVVFVDADQAVAPTALRTLLDPLLEDRADLAIGVRVDPGGGVGTLQPHARFGNRLVLALAGLLFGARWRDLGPFRAIRLPALLALDMDDRTWGWTLQMQIRARRRGLRVVEVDVPHRRRIRGRSKITGSLTVSLRVGARMLLTLLRERLRR